MTGGPGIPVWLPERKGVSHSQARIPASLSGNGKGRKERKPEGLEACRGEVTLIFPGLHVLELPAPTLAKSLFPIVAHKRGTQGLVQGAAGAGGGCGCQSGSWGQEGTRDNRFRFSLATHRPGTQHSQLFSFFLLLFYT